MTGIANALSYIHNDVVVHDSSRMSGYHFDLKPENILIFADGSSTMPQWKRADFGPSHFHPEGATEELPPHPGLGAYEPPECQLELPQSQAWDIWSLGCIFLECTAWLLKGSSAIDAFAEDRLNDLETSGNAFKDDYFFTLENNELDIPVRVMTRPAVIKWIRDLPRDPNFSESITGLLQLVEDRLLRVDQSQRCKAKYLNQKLDLLCNKEKTLLEPGIPVIPEERVTEVDDRSEIGHNSGTCT